MIVATIVVSAQMSTDALDNMTMNNSTLNESINETQIADTSESNEATGISIAIQNPIQNENADTATNETSINDSAYEPKNATSEIVLANNANITIETTQPNLTPFESPENTIFAISSGLESNDIFQIGSEVEPRKAFLVSLPTKPIRDLSNMLFA